MAQTGQAADEKSADPELVSRIKDLLPPDVRRALANLAAAARHAVADDLGEGSSQPADDRAEPESGARHGGRTASRSQGNDTARRSPLEPQHRKRRAFAKVIVMDHARERARERFPGFKAARIVDEVHAALLAGRVSARKPPGMIDGRGDFPYGLYAWTEDGERIYGIMHGENCFAVHTTMRRATA
jgi:hypothetical protein